jgi:phosphonate transport system permease protein
MPVSKNVKASFGVVVVGFIAFLFADLSITTLDTSLLIKDFFGSILYARFEDYSLLIEGFLNTIAIAIVSIFIASIIGFFLALFFKNFFLRIALSFTRAIHELFWALIFLQIFGLNTLSAILAIIIPYSAILAKVYAEILEEHDHFPKLLVGENRLSYFLYTQIPDAFPHLVSYTLYRFECALRSTAILGFVGITTLGYYLSSSFMQGYYHEVWLILILFYVVIATIRWWFTKYSFLFLTLASFLYLDDFSGFNWNNLVRFVTSDIIPHPIRNDLGMEQTYTWFSNIFSNEIVLGVFNTIVLTQLSLLLTAVLALLVFSFVSRQFFSKPTNIFSHLILVILRSTPEYILAYVFLQLFGPSMLPAALALMLHNGAIIGHLMGNETNLLKLRLDVTKKRTSKYFFEVLPRVYNQFLAFLFYRWEIIMRESAILGILGVATLGFFIDSAIADFRLDKMFLLLVVTALLNIGVDLISKKVREYLRSDKAITSCGCSLK